jgi:hypothetical protein
MLGLATAACGPSVEQTPTDSDTQTDGASTSETSGSSTTSGTRTTDDTSSDKWDVGGSSSTTGDPIECGFWGNDCGSSSKCMPGGDNVCGGFYGVWCNGGGWDRTACVHVDDDPVALGAACEISWWGKQSDGCDHASLCLPHDGNTEEGRCTPLCSGAVEEPICEDPDTACALVGGVDIPVCLQICDPEADDCSLGASCRDSLTGPSVCISNNL